MIKCIKRLKVEFCLFFLLHKLSCDGFSSQKRDVKDQQQTDGLQTSLGSSSGSWTPLDILDPGGRKPQRSINNHSTLQFTDFNVKGIGLPVWRSYRLELFNGQS